MENAEHSMNLDSIGTNTIVEESELNELSSLAGQLRDGLKNEKKNTPTSI